MGRSKVKEIILPQMNDTKKTKAYRKGGLSEQTLVLINFLASMPVDSSALLRNQYRSKSVIHLLRQVSKSKRIEYDPIRDMDFEAKMGIDGEYHVWRDR